MKRKEFNRKAKKAYKIFQTMGWVYHDGPPTLDRIKETMRDLLHSVEGGCCSSATGRFIAIKGRAGEDAGIYIDL